RVIARKDPAWAKRLIDAQQNWDAKTHNTANINTALSLTEDDPALAVEFAQRGLQDQLNPAYLHFLITLRKSDQARADDMFLQVLSFLGQQQQADIKGLHLMGIYLFTAPNMLDSDNYSITRVDDILVPNITVQRNGIPPALVRAYLSTAGTMLL